MCIRDKRQDNGFRQLAQNGSPAWTGGLGFGSGQRIWGWILGSWRLQSGLAGGRLIPYKRVDLAVRAFTQLGLPLLVYGEGRDLDSLRAIAGPHVTFLGRVSWARLVELFQNCRAFIFPGLEDFGIAPLEAQACGRPVIAFAGGGSFDTVVDGETGILFSEPRVESLQAAVHRFESLTLDPDQIRRHAERFSAARFRRESPLMSAARLRRQWAKL